MVQQYVSAARFFATAPSQLLS